MKSYSIRFKAFDVKNNKKYVEFDLSVGDFLDDVKLERGSTELLVMCVEFARLNGFACEFAEILEITEI